MALLSDQDTMPHEIKFNITKAVSLLLVVFLLAPAFHFGLRFEITLSVFTFALIAVRKKVRVRVFSIFTFVLALFLLTAVFHFTASPLSAREYLSSNTYSILWPMRAALLLLLLTLFLNTKERYFSFLRTFYIVSGALFFVYVIYHFTLGLVLTHDTFNRIDFRLSGFFFNPNYFAAVYLFSLSIFFLATSQSLALSEREKMLKFPATPHALIFLCIVLSQSRTAIVAAFFSFFMFLAIEFVRQIFKENRPGLIINRVLLLSIIFGSLLIISAVSFALFFFEIRDRFSQILDVGSSSRGSLWVLSMEAIKNTSPNAFLFGFGPGAFSQIEGNDRNFWAHNSYLSLILDYGVFGTLILSSLIFYLFFYQRSLASFYMVMPQLIFAAGNDIFYAPIFWISLIVSYIFTKNGWRRGGWAEKTR